LDQSNYSVFEREILVRPDDIDMNNHVHFSKYLDYFLAARYDQMNRCYKLSMEEFIEMGYSWVASKMEINFKRALLLGDTAIVKTQLNSANGAQVKVNFWIVSKSKNKIVADGTGVFTLINISNLRPVRIPQNILDKYSV
jgi:acyl-CoA thioester hydrolase/thioesterase-3